jgi:hypothetical protein
VSLADTLADSLAEALTAHSNARPRSLQKTVGPSEIGFCRRKAVFKATGTPRSDTPEPGVIPTWPADIGTAIHTLVDHALDGDERYVLGSGYGPVTAALPSGAEVTGTFDIAIPGLNLLLDVKTVDGYTWVKNQPVSQNHEYQRHLYALGAAQAGLLVDDETLKVGNVYLDRSGKEKRPLIKIDDYNPSLIAEIDEWVQDVIYGIQHGPDTAAQDIAAERCPSLCEWFTTCRGGVLPDTHNPVLITDPDAISAVDMYVRAREMESEAKRMSNTAKAMLVGINGLAGEYQVRWTEVAASQGYTTGPRDPYMKIAVTKVKR